MKATVWFDGACSGNPGPMGAGAVVVTAEDRKVLSMPMGHGTNNEAEYHAIILGLRHALAMGASQVVVHGDSQLILRQLEGRYRVSAANLQALHAQASSLLGRFETRKLEWVPRAQNGAADEAARAAIGA